MEEMTVKERYERVLEKMSQSTLTTEANRVRYETAKESFNRNKDELNQLKKDEENLQKAMEAFKKISDARSEDAKNMLESVLNWTLSNVELNQEYQARLIERQRGQSGKELEIELTDINTGYTRNLTDQSGTALAQIVSLIMVAIVIKFSGATRIMVLDEYMSGIEDPETVKMFGKILVALGENEGFQFIIVEHQDLLDTIEGMNVYRLALTDYEEGTEIAEKFQVDEATTTAEVGTAYK